MLVRFLSLALVLLLGACSEGQRAERRIEDIEADMKAKAEAGTLTADEFAASMDEMAALAEEVRNDEDAIVREREHELASFEKAQQDLREFNRQVAQNAVAALERMDPPPRPIEDIRSSATAAVDRLEALHTETLARLAELGRADRSQRRYATNAASSLRIGWSDRLARNRVGLTADKWRTLRRIEDSANRSIAEHDKYLNEAVARLARIAQAGAAVTTDVPRPGRARTPPRTSDPAASPTPFPAPAATPAPARTVEAARAEANTAIEAVEQLHDQLIALHETIADTHTDSVEKKRARDAATMARFAKKQDLEGWRRDVAADAMFRIDGAARRARRAVQALEAKVAEATATLDLLTKPEG